MRLREWCDSKGRGILKRLERETGLSYTTLYARYSEHGSCRYETAVKISKATKGKVSIGELMSPRSESRAS